MDVSPSGRAQQLLAEPVRQHVESPRKPSLLPAFEPLSSSPFPRPQSAKRKYAEDSPSYPKQQLKYYPTPVPTSSTGILASSSPQNARPGLNRTISTLSERVPLGAMPSVELPADGEVVRMGRSSNSSDYQLSANRLISRVHVQAAYHAPSASNATAFVEIECLGWNGAKIHCRGRVYKLEKGQSWGSEDPEEEIMLDVQDTRVTIVWPVTTSGGKFSWDSEDDVSPSRRPVLDHLASSPPVVPRSPVSQSPIRQPNFGLAPVAPSPAPVQVFEDADAEEANASCRSKTPTPADITFIRPTLSRSASASDPRLQDSKSSLLSSFAEDFSDGDEENDPIVHSFGPFGENILPRLASFSTATPTQAGAGRRRRPLLTYQSPQQRSSSESVRFKESPIKNHVINQLAFSRVHSIPLSAVHGNLPAELRACAVKSSNEKDKSSNGSGASTPIPELSKQDLKKMMDDIPCIGEIPRSGKDAAGKPLENEFYYVPEMDMDQSRRDIVTNGMRGTGLRAVRKQHKQYYWKRPRV
ncbi:hypothetical protein K491DRAFT_702983 [Lophiostoma macrostomum CBS 122681]|uniref:FHA domain-containing protein n=1 Tax=Lophiostoma macrostomum CBS 122681 TaxID=1314788 RepID=A0A6A6TFW3_9PLEO|nr:hypothetical protein K491DRAFT_702983 [Lophiostoma macrostomum CBS 122681]